MTRERVEETYRHVGVSTGRLRPIWPGKDQRRYVDTSKSVFVNGVSTDVGVRFPGKPGGRKDGTVENEFGCTDGSHLQPVTRFSLFEGNWRRLFDGAEGHTGWDLLGGMTESIVGLYPRRNPILRCLRVTTMGLKTSRVRIYNEVDNIRKSTKDLTTYYQN